ncbi:MAG: hypothetical protein EAZ42_06885 [Verrucomicrobia bacterium]|nr:MAG: hypothetical protein EAZ42_06885 [Verrucomicrobiota bacterium]
MPSYQRMLIATAAFGEGHNSAARSLAAEFERRGLQVKIIDPCLLAAPILMRQMGSAYRSITTHLPKVWAGIYHSADRIDLGKRRNPILSVTERALAAEIRAFSPDAVVSTFPLYPYFLPRIYQKMGRALPSFTVITDSIEINSAWLRASCDRWFVTDEYSRSVMLEKAIPEGKISVTGFPVHPSFAEIPRLDMTSAAAPFRVLYFPTSKASSLRHHGRVILNAAPEIQLTLILGRNVRRLYPLAKDLKNSFPGRVKIVGWTKRVPSYLSNHHLVIGKAGGATVHEAIAAHCPMLIHHLVPGQEEGNLKLLEKIKAGALAEKPAALTQALQEMLMDDARHWREMKLALAKHNTSNGAARTVDSILQFPFTHPS